MSEAVLAIDTCGPRPRLALRVNGRFTAATSEESDSRADDAASLAGSLLRGAGLGVESLTGIGVTIGPGSYTGVRIGLALVRGLSVVDRIPVVGTGTLELLAAAASVGESRVCAVLDAGGDKVYVAVFEREGAAMRPVTDPRVVSRPRLRAMVDAEVGSAALVRSEDEPEVACGRPVVAVPGPQRIAKLAELSAQRLQRGDGSSADLVLPLYVGATGARPNRNKVVTAAFPDE
jgi:tRNA threonylcarbamoyladenosine biosynthesis protein TsaB